MDVKQTVESHSKIGEGYMTTKHSTWNISGRNVQLGENNLLVQETIDGMGSTKTPASERCVPERKVLRKLSRKRIYDDLENDNGGKLVVDMSSSQSPTVSCKSLEGLRKKLFQDDESDVIERASDDFPSENGSQDLMPTENTCQLDLGKGCFVVAKRFRGELLIHVRVYERRLDGSIFPTKRGIALGLQRWKKLEQCSVSDVDRCIREYREGKDVKYMFHLGGNYHVSVKSGFPCVDIRSWFLPENSDNICATRKGISLTFEQFDKLKGAMVVVREFLGKELEDIIFCENSDDHQNQEGALRCRECHPNGYLIYQD